MSRKSCSLVLAAICTAATAVPLAKNAESQEARPRPFIVAALSVGENHRVTALEMIARFTGNEWVSTWPPGDEHTGVLPALTEVPLDWLGKPVPRTWAVSFDRTHRLSVTVDHLERLLGCTNLIEVGLSQPTAVPTGIVDSDQINIAVDTPAQAVEGFRKLGEKDAEWRSRADAILATYRAHATTLVQTMSNPDWARKALQGVDLSTVPVQISYLYRQVAPGAALTYLFEATQETRRSDGALSGVRVRGWLRVDAKGIPSSFKLTGGAYSDEGMGSVKPLAWFRLGTHTYWLLRINGYEDYRFSITEITATDAREVLSAGGGGC